MAGFKRRLLLLLGGQASALLLAATVRSQPASGPGSRVPLPDTIQPVVTEQKDVAAAWAGSLRPALVRGLDATEAAAPMQIEIVLKTRHYSELQERVAAGEIIGAAEMAARYLPRQEDYDAVSQWLSAQGLSVRKTGAAHALVIASGSPAQMEQALGAKFARVLDRGAEYTAAISAPALPAELAALVSNIHGLQPFLQPHKSIVAPLDINSTNPPFLVSQILQAYDVDASGVDGTGQQIGIVIDTVPRDSDLTSFWYDNDVNQNLSNIITVNVSGKSLPAPTGEETLDVSWSSGIAPGAEIVIYACGNLDYVDESYSQILDDLQSGARPKLHQVSMSFAGGEITDETPADMNSTSQMFTSMTAYGVSLFAGSGDNGAYGDKGTTIQVDYPASDPSVVGVGGTSLTLAVSGNEQTETAWSPTSQSKGSSGGGVSSFFSRPSWQVGSTVPAGSMRLVPDVALDADPATGAYLILAGRVAEYGGTSWSSPTWAGLCALLNQARANSGVAPLGLVNTKFYPLLGTDNFRDITSGGNGVYNAGIGYDFLTGIGVPDFDVLLTALVPPMLTAPVITSSLKAIVGVGVAFNYQIKATESPTSYNATGLPAGLHVSGAGLISGTAITGGVYPVTLTAANSAGTGYADLEVVIANGAPIITSPTEVTGQVGSAFRFQITASGSPTDFTALLLPPGLTINPVNGVISGKPLVANTSGVELAATNHTGTGNSNVIITIAARPVVTITADVPSAVAGSGQPGQFTLKRRSGDTALSLPVSYTVRGSAEPGVDFLRLKGTKTIRAGETTAFINVVPLASDPGGAAAMTVTVTLEKPADDAYRVGAEASAQVKIIAQK